MGARVEVGYLRFSSFLPFPRETRMQMQADAHVRGSWGDAAGDLSAGWWRSKPWNWRSRGQHRRAQAEDPARGPPALRGGGGEG